MLSDLLEDVNVRAAHLTLHRDEPHSYPVSQAGAELLQEIRRFLELAPPELFVIRPTADLWPEWAKATTGVPIAVTTNVSVGPEIALLHKGGRWDPK